MRGLPSLKDNVYFRNGVLLSKYGPAKDSAYEDVAYQFFRDYSKAAEDMEQRARSG